MSDQYRSPLLESRQEPEPNRNYGLVIAGVGVLIIIGAVVYMLISPLLRDFDLGTEPVAVAIVEDTLISTPEAPLAVPTATPAPTSTPAAIESSPVPTETPGSPVESDYPERAGEIMSQLSESIDRYIALMTSPDFGSDEWKADLEREFTIWESTYDEVGSLVSTGEYRESHESLMQATTHFRDATGGLRPWIMDGDQSGMTSGFEDVVDGSIHLNDARARLERETWNQR